MKLQRTHKPSSEALLISALLNTQDVEAAMGVAITPEMFIGYQAEYRWLLSYRKSYGKQPSTDAFITKFPNFPLTDHIDVEWSADQMRYSYTRRTLSRTLNAAALSVSEGDLEEAVFAIKSFQVPEAHQVMRNSLVDMSILDGYEKPVDAIDVPWPTLQETTGGMRGGDLWYVAARLGMGKSWTVTEIAANALMAGKNVLFYTLEMSGKQVLSRMHALLAAKLGLDIKHSEIHHKTLDILAYKKLLREIEEKVEGQFFIIDPSAGAINPATVQTQCGSADLVIIDYVQLMSSVLGSKSIDDWRIAGGISNMLKEIALTHDIPILCAAQINREGDTSYWKPPKVKNLSASDALGQDADVVITHKQYSKSAMVYSVEKNRHGESQVLYFTKFLPNTGSFVEIDKDEADDLKDSDDDD